jgi:hypothetical protein
MPRWLAWTIRVIATIEAVDALLYMADAGWAEAHPVLVALTVGGLVGLAPVWLAGPVLKPEWLWLAVGALLVAAAPAVLYPLSGLLVVGAVAAVVFGVRGRRQQILRLRAG